MTQPPKQLTPVPDLPPFYKPGSQLEIAELRYAAIPGQPSITYWDSSNGTCVSICPTPQLGLIISMLDTLGFVVLASRPGNTFDKDEAAKYIELATNKIDLGDLCTDAVDELEYKLAMDATPVQDKFGTTYRAVMCVPVSRAVFEQNLSLALLQGEAAKRIAAAIGGAPQAGQAAH